MDTETTFLLDTEPAPDGRRLRVAFGVLITGVSVVAMAVFALSFYGLNDFGHRVMGLPGELSWLVPVGLDVFSLCGIAATYLLRHANGRVRLYSWVVFLVPAGLSVAGNWGHAEHRHLSHAGMAGAAVVPVILALATHLVVVVRRHLETDTQTTPGLAVGPMVELAEFPQLTTPESVPSDPRDAEPPNDTAEDTNGAAENSDELRALFLLAQGHTVPEVALEIGKDRRTVQRWLDNLYARARPGRGGARRAAAGGGSDDSREDKVTS